jgi:uncharacterized lipoprotein YmbA
MGNYLVFLERMQLRKKAVSKKLIAIMLSTSAIVLSACALNMKPEHPQAYQSFQERRAPIENAAAQTGTYVDSERKSSFARIDAKNVVYSKANDSKSQAATDNSFAGTLKSGINQVTGSSNANQSSNVNNSTSNETKSFFERLTEKFSGYTQSLPKSVNLSDNSPSQKFVPVENQIAIAQFSDPQIEQGSNSGNDSYYDNANDIEFEPNIPSKAEIAAKSDALPKVELKQVPLKIDEKFYDDESDEEFEETFRDYDLGTEADIKKRKPKSTQKPAPNPTRQSSKQGEQVSFNFSPSSAKILDPRAHLVFRDGKAMVIGVL